MSVSEVKTLRHYTSMFIIFMWHIVFNQMVLQDQQLSDNLTCATINTWSKCVFMQHLFNEVPIVIEHTGCGNKKHTVEGALLSQWFWTFLPNFQALFMK